MLLHNLSNCNYIFHYIDPYTQETPLFLACKYGKISLVKYLISHGCDPFIQTINGLNSLQISIFTALNIQNSYFLSCSSSNSSIYHRNSCISLDKILNIIEKLIEYAGDHLLMSLNQLETNSSNHQFGLGLGLVEKSMSNGLVKYKKKIQKLLSNLLDNKKI